MDLWIAGLLGLSSIVGQLSMRVPLRSRAHPPSLRCYGGHVERWPTQSRLIHPSLTVAKKEVYKGSLTHEWYNKEKSILLAGEKALKTSKDIPAPRLNWVNKDGALFFWKCRRRF